MDTLYQYTKQGGLIGFLGGQKMRVTQTHFYTTRQRLPALSISLSA